MYPSCLPFANFKNRLPSSWPASALQAHDAEEYKRLEAAGAQVIQKRCPDPLRLGLFDVCSMMVEKIRYIHHVQTHPHHSAHAICSSADVNLVDSAVVHCPAAVQDAKGMTTGKLLAASSSLSRVSQWMAAMLLLGERASVESATQPGLECLGLPCHDPWVTDASRSDQGNDMGDYSQSQGGEIQSVCRIESVMRKAVELFAGMVWPQSLTSPILQVWLSTAFCGIKLGLPRRFLTRSYDSCIYCSLLDNN